MHGWFQMSYFALWTFCVDLTDHVAQIEESKSELQQELQKCITNQEENVLSINLKIAGLKQRARCIEKDCSELKMEHKRVKNNKWVKLVTFNTLFHLTQWNVLTM